jgi:UMF1 family MFS transporter
MGMRTLRATLADLPRHAGVGRFLLAHMFYADALATLFTFGGVYAAGTFGMSTAEIIRFGIVLNVAAGAGATAFAWADDRFGAKAIISLSLVALAAATIGMLATSSVASFWLLATAVGVFVGPAQAASRSYMARVAPRGVEAEMFGLFALSGKATAFAGPWLVALVTSHFASQRAGMVVVPLFLLVGLTLLRGVREAPSSRHQHAAAQS